MLWSFFAKPGQTVPVVSSFEKGIESADPDRAAPHQRLPHASGVQHPPLRDRHAALHPHALRQGPGAGPQHDPAGQLHHEAQRHQRDDSHHLARVRQHPPVRAARPVAGLRRTRPAAARLAVPGHGLRRHQPAAQCRLAGRIRRPAGHQGLSRGQRPGPPQHLPDPVIGPRHQPGQRPDGRHDRWS